MVGSFDSLDSIYFKKKDMKKLILLFISAILTLSCSDDTNEVQEAPQTVELYRLTKQTQTNPSGTIYTYDYEYNTNGSIDRIIFTDQAGSQITTFFYNNEGQIIKATLDNSFSNYTYNDSGQVIKRLSVEDNENPNSTRVYEYNVTGQKIKSTQFDNNGNGNLIEVASEVFTYNSSNNVILIEHSEGYTTSGITYDNYNRPQSAMGLTEAFYWVDERPSMNNLISIDGNESESMYQYNDKEYPVFKETNSEFMGQTISATWEWEYETKVFEQ